MIAAVAIVPAWLAAFLFILGNLDKTDAPIVLAVLIGIVAVPALLIWVHKRGSRAVRVGVAASAAWALLVVLASLWLISGDEWGSADADRFPYTLILPIFGGWALFGLYRWAR